ncbi:hypothetical protein [Microcoleus sp. F10-D1]|uniref:hypothetical protein n=2 Tax=Microcoleus TaxID=44471 RepID=UPI0040408CDC
MPGPTDTNFFHRAGMDDTKAGADKKDDPAEVAKQGFEALMADKDNIIAGSLKTKILASASKVLPDTVNRLLAKVLSIKFSDGISGPSHKRKNFLWDGPEIPSQLFLQEVY